MASSSRGEEISDAIRAADSASLVAELKRRGIDVDDKKQSHVVGELRAKDEFSDARAAALDAALGKLGIAGMAALLGGPPLKAYNSFVRPRKFEDDAGCAQSTENAAHQIAFLHRHELARRDTLLRNTDDAARARRAANLEPHRISIVLDNVRSAENVGSILRSADCARCLEVVTCGFTPNAMSTSKIAKTAFGAEAAVPQRHFDSTLSAVEALKKEGATIWALETLETASSYTTAPLPPSSDGGHVALVLGNEVTGVDSTVLAIVDHFVEIPTYGTKNSMNVACCASIVIFDVLRRWQIH